MFFVNNDNILCGFSAQYYHCDYFLVYPHNLKMTTYQSLSLRKLNSLSKSFASSFWQFNHLFSFHSPLLFTMKQQAAGGRRRLSHGLHSDTGVSSAQRPTGLSACCGSGGAGCRPPDPETAEESLLRSVFMPEFPHSQSPEHQKRFQVMSAEIKVC